MAGQNKPFTIYNYMRMPDGTDLLMCKIENRGQLNEKITRYITEEQREELSKKMMGNASRVMSEYYSQKKSKEKG